MTTKSYQGNVQINRQREYAVTPTLSTNAHTAGDVVAYFKVPIEYTPEGTATLRSIRVVDDGDDKAALTLYIFNDEPVGTPIAANAAFTCTVANLKKLVKTVAIAAGDYTSISDGTGNNAYAIKDGLAIDIVPPDGVFSFWVYVTTSGTPTYAISDLTFTFTYWGD